MFMMIGDPTTGMPTQPARRFVKPGIQVVDKNPFSGIRKRINKQTVFQTNTFIKDNKTGNSYRVYYNPVTDKCVMQNVDNPNENYDLSDDYNNYMFNNASYDGGDNIVNVNNFNETHTNKTASKTTVPVNSGSSVSSTPAKNPDNTAALSKEIQALKNQIADLTRVIPADELAARYGINLSEQDRLNDYNNQTNQFFDNLIKYQEDVREDTLHNNSAYDQRILENYVDSYANSAKTQTGQAARAANMLSTLNTNSYNTSYNDYQLLQSILNLEKEREKELAQNIYTAKKDTTNLRTRLSGYSAMHNTSDVQDYVNELNALGKRYEATRATAAANADAAATKYSGLVNAQGAYNNSTNGQFDTYLNYLKATGRDSVTSAKTIRNNLNMSIGNTK